MVSRMNWAAAVLAISILVIAVDEGGAEEGDLLAGAVARLGWHRFVHPDRIRNVEFTPDGDRLLTSGMNGDLNFWNAATGRHLRTVGELDEGYISSMQIVEGGARVWWAAEYQQTGLRDLETGKDLRMLENAHAYRNLALSPGGEWLAAGNQAWDLATGKVISAERYGGHHDFGIAISPWRFLPMVRCWWRLAIPDPSSGT